MKREQLIELGLFLCVCACLCVCVCVSHLASGLGADGEAEERGRGRVGRHLELPEGCGVALDGLGNLPVHRVQLNGPHHAVLLCVCVCVRGREGGRW